MILRAWQTISKDTGEVLDVHRYFPGDRVFKPGPESVAAFFRRSVFISGLASKYRRGARNLSTDKFDGTLLYQLYLVGNLLMAKPGYYVSRMTAIRRVGGEHYFGSSVSERERFVPRTLDSRALFEFCSWAARNCPKPRIRARSGSGPHDSVRYCALLIPASCHPGANEHQEPLSSATRQNWPNSASANTCRFACTAWRFPWLGSGYATPSLTR